MKYEGPVRISTSQIEPSRRQGGEARAVLTPKTVGTTAGFMAELALDPGESMIEHYHPWSDEHVVVIEGRIGLLVEGTEVELGPGDATFVRRGARHGYRNLGAERARAVAFFGPLAPDPADGHVDLEPAPHPGATAENVGAPS